VGSYQLRDRVMYCGASLRLCSESPDLCDA
jgi:hypothetical protein